MSWLNYHHLFYFYSIAKESSISNASKKLNTTQSSLSSQLKTLENNLGIMLFERVGRRLVLTDKGQHVYKLAERIFEIGDILVSEVENNQLGSSNRLFRVGAVSTLSKNIQQMFFSPLFKTHKKLDIHSSDLNSLINKLENFDVDIVMTNRLPSNLDEKFQTHTIESFPYCLVSRENIKPIEIESIIKEKGVCIPKADPYNTTLIKDFLDQFAPSDELIKVKVEDTALLRLMCVGEGELAIIPKIGVYKDLVEGSLKVVKTLNNINETFYLISRKESFELMNIDVLIKEFKNKLTQGDL